MFYERFYGDEANTGLLVLGGCNPTALGGQDPPGLASLGLNTPSLDRTPTASLPKGTLGTGV